MTNFASEKEKQSINQNLGATVIPRTIMKMNKKQITSALREANEIEVYEYTDSTCRIHTDFIDSLDLDLDSLPYNAQGEIDVDIFVMDEKEYASTVLANSSISTEEFWVDGYKIGVVVLR